MTKKKIILISLLVIAVVVIGFIGYHYIRYLKATSRMEELSADLERRISEWEKKEYKRPPLSWPPVAGNAAEFYQEAEERLENHNNAFPDLFVAIDNDITNTLNTKAKGYYERNKYLVGTVLKGINTEAYKSLSNLRETPNIKTSSLLTMRTIPAIMVLQGRESENNHRITEAIELYCGIIRLGDDYVCKGGSLYAMIGLTVSEFGQKEINRLLLQTNISQQDLLQLINYLKILSESKRSFPDVWDAESLVIEIYLKQWAETNGFVPSKKYTDFWVTRADCIDAWPEIISMCDDVKRIVSLPYIQANDEGKKFDSRLRMSQHYMVQINIPLYAGTCINEYARAIALHRGIYILTALKLYHAQHGKYPEKLSDLSPEIISEVPLDPFTDKPFVYRVDDKGTLWLYSLGENMTDDGGNPELEKDLAISPVK